MTHLLTWVIVLLAAAGPAQAEFLLFDDDPSWQNWDMPYGLVEIDETTGVLRLVKFHKETDAVQNAHRHTHLTKQRGEVAGGIWASGSGSIPSSTRSARKSPKKNGTVRPKCCADRDSVLIALAEPHRDALLHIDFAAQLVRNAALIALDHLAPQVHIDFPLQYVRFIRWQRKESILDQAYGLTESSASGSARKGTIADFELFGQGVPRRALYASRIIDLAREVNFGRLHWSGTPLRLVDGAVVEDPDAPVWLKAKVRVGRDDSPATYHEYTNIGREKEVSREHYESLTAQLNRDPRPGIRASIGYDSANWSFWSVPFTESGQLIRLRSGSHLQVDLSIESRDFDAWMRIDSLWIETAPLLAAEVFAEVARRDDPQPKRGFTEVALGQETEFIYQVRAEFNGNTAPGFNALRIHTGNRTAFRRLEMGTDSRSGNPLTAGSRH